MSSASLELIPRITNIAPKVNSLSSISIRGKILKKKSHSDLHSVKQHHYYLAGHDRAVLLN